MWMDFRMDTLENDNNLETLGKRIRRAREKKGFSITELAGLLKSSESNVRRWESGASNVRADTVHRLSAVLNISYQEELYWLGLAGHLPAVRLPSKEQIINLLERYYKKIQTLTFPCYMLDRYLRVWALNDVTTRLAGNVEFAKHLISQKTSLLDAVFDRQKGLLDFIPPDYLEGLRREFVVHLLSINAQYRHEASFNLYINEYVSRLQRDDPITADVFNSIWNLESERIFTFHTPSDRELSAMVGEVSVQLPIPNVDEANVRFHVITQPIRELGGLFEVVYVYPHPGMDPNSATIVREFFATAFELNTNIKLWELVDSREIDSLLKA